MVRTSRFTVLAVLVMVLILLVSTGTLALAQEGGGEEPMLIPGSAGSPGVQQAPVPGGPGFLMIPAAAFTPVNSGTLYYNGTALNTQQGSPYIAYHAPVNLPHGVTVTKLVLYYIDTDLPKSAKVYLYRHPVLDVWSFAMAGVSSPEDQLVSTWSYTETTTITDPVIDNQATMYYINVELPIPGPAAILMISGVCIDYGYTVMLPGVTR